MDIIQQTKRVAEHLISQPVNYKYYKPDTAITVLREQKLQFSHASTFNDPFDCNVQLFEFDPEEVYKYSKDLIKKAKGSNYSERFRLHNNYQKKVASNPAEYMQKIYECENNNRGVTCFSKKCDQLLMWAHYGANHTGVCLGYDLLELRKLVKNQNKETMFLLTDYVNEIIPLKDFKDESMIFHWFGTKHKIWKHEDEIRLISRPLIFNEKKRNYFKIPKELIREIYLGYLFSEVHEAEIIELIQTEYSHVSLFKVLPDYKTFKLIKEEILI